MNKNFFTIVGTIMLLASFSMATGITCTNPAGQTKFVQDPSQKLWGFLTDWGKNHTMQITVFGEKVPLKCDCHGCYWSPNGYTSKCSSNAVIPTWACPKECQLGVPC